MPRKTKRKARYGMTPTMRAFDDLVRDLESVRRRMRNWRPRIQQLDLYAEATKRALAEVTEEAHAEQETPLEA